MIQRKRTGISLAEVVVSTLLIGVLMSAALTSVGAAARSSTIAADVSTATLLARELMDEIIVLAYEEPTQVPVVFGLESGESSGSSRLQFDDLDDYMNWSDTPPRSKSGVATANLTGWQRSADVQKVNKANYVLSNDNATDQGIRIVTVRVVSPSGKAITLSSYRSKNAGCIQSQGAGQTVVTWVGIGLQTGSSESIASGTAVLNHAGDQ